jgi:hypothetical protein
MGSQLNSTRALALPLAYAHGITYPAELDRIMSSRLEQL